MNITSPAGPVNCILYFSYYNFSYTFVFVFVFVIVFVFVRLDLIFHTLHFCHCPCICFCNCVSFVVAIVWYEYYLAGGPRGPDPPDWALGRIPITPCHTHNFIAFLPLFLFFLYFFSSWIYFPCISYPCISSQMSFSWMY